MTDYRPYRKNRLFCPGPTPVTLDSQLAIFNQSLYHRTQDFYTIFSGCREQMSKLFGSREHPLILSSSGTGAMEAAVVNLTDVGDEVLCLNGGKFGARWAQLCDAYQCKTHELKFSWGEQVPLERLEEILKANRNIKAVFFQANETSTGTSFRVEEITKMINQHTNALTVLDGISALGVEQISMDQWNVDCILTGSQKGLGIPPGLSFICLQKRLWEQISHRPKFYFDLKKEKEQQDKGQSAFTPAISHILMLKSSLQQMNAIGLEKIYESHLKVAKAVRGAFEEMGLNLFAKRYPSPGLTAVNIPENIDGKLLINSLREKYGMTFAGGQENYKGKILRFAHLGYFDPGDIAAGLIAIETELSLLGHSCSKGCGARVFWQIYHDLSL